MNNFIKKMISYRLSYVLFIVFSITAITYHVLIITHVVDYSNVWGGRLTRIETMYVFEAISLFMQILFTAIATLKYTKIGSATVQKILTLLLYVLSGFFILNTFGNILSTSLIEVLVFAPATFIMSVATYRLALGDE